MNHIIRILCLCYLAVIGCATLKSAERNPCPPHDLATLDARYVAEAVSTCKAELDRTGLKGADECQALPGIRAKYSAERARWVECAK